MNSTDCKPVTADDYLDLLIESARCQFDNGRVEDAAGRLRERFSLARRANRPAISRTLKGLLHRISGGIYVVGTALALFVVMALAPLYMSNDNSAVLAQALQRFTSFQTLQVEAIVVEAGSGTETDLITWFDESGNTRIESNGVTTILKPEEGLIYVLRSDGQVFAQRFPTDVSVVGSSADFLEIVQGFQESDRLPESRVIDDIPAIGYKRVSDGWTTVLWIDPSDGRPLLVEQENANGVRSRGILRFDVPLPDNAFDVPDDVQVFEPRE